MWSATVEFRYKTSVEALVLNADKTFKLCHKFPFSPPNAFKIRVTITDDDGGSVTHQGNKLYVTGTLDGDSGDDLETLFRTLANDVYALINEQGDI